ncbi:hypothetical protein [Helicobacter mustelae]|uniref:Protein hydE n=1 Tax=Helicobacter mustelae (strain ATCC 43772 / CCUG 25715 / CIP 103759 / LMG 18044 / NCTC 12198 / R85-136P) TaxID=679897 RepID=D3UIC1_HELM1|nr:hypothetical protein [Helicobacter mustelae]CBG40244.1 Putative hypothetical protein [Helicobacter mustelae 12198]SQH71743.1 Protein hydE [Helicobacter mustelae]
MIFAFKFALANKERASILFEILYFQANTLGLEFAESFGEEWEEKIDYYFYLFAKQEEMLEFADAISSRIPISIYFQFDSIKELEDLRDLELAPKRPMPPFPPLDAKVIQEVIGDFSLLQGYLSPLEIFAPILSPTALQNALKKCIELLREDALIVRSTRGKVLLSCKKKSKQVLFWDLSSVKTYMRVESLQAQFLASYEKPSQDLCAKEVFAEEFGTLFLECFLPYDLFLSILGAACLKQEIGYVFLTQLDNFQEPLNAKNSPKAQNSSGQGSANNLENSSGQNTTNAGNSPEDLRDLSPQVFYEQKGQVPPKEKIVVAQNGVILHTKSFRGNVFELIAAHEKTLSFVNNKRLQNDKNLIVCFSKNHPTFFWLGKEEKYQSVLGLELDCNAKNVIEKIKKIPHGEKLIKNFFAEFPEMQKKISALPDAPMPTRNLFAFFSVLSFVAGYEEEYNPHSTRVLENARKYVRDKGPRIDYKILKDEKGHLFLDYPKILRSMMSFLLAGVDEATLSYGVFDSMGECFGNFIQDLCVNFSLQNVLIFGNLLEEKIFLDKILHYAPRQVNFVLPKNGFLDVQRGKNASRDAL